MKMTPESYLILAAIAGGLYLAWSAKAAVKTAANAVNPVNPNNVINQGVNALTGHDNKTSSIGTGFFEWLNPSAVEAEKLAASPIKPAAVRVTK